MMRDLAQLAAVMPKDDPARPEVLCALQLGLRARNQDFTGPGVSTKNKSMEALLLVNRAFAGDQDFLRGSLCVEALNALGKLVSAQSLRGSDPLGPREWGLFLEFIVWREGPPATLCEIEAGDPAGDANGADRRRSSQILPWFESLPRRACAW